MRCLSTTLLFLFPLFGGAVSAQTTVLYRHERPHCWALGTEMLGLGDINRDAYEDYATSATESPYRVDYPFVEAISGRSGLQLWEFRGPANSRLGAVMVLGADYDQDGLRDILVGAPQWNNGAGQVYILSTKTGQQITTIAGAAGDTFGTAVADAGDVDRDGKPDILVGAPSYPNNQNWGKAVVVSGANYSTVLATFLGAGAGMRLGLSVIGAGDIDSDGYADYLIGEPGLNQVRAYSGRFRALLYTLSGTSEFGYSLGRPGDVDGDGSEDLLVSHTNSGNGGSFCYQLRTGAPLFTIPGGGGSYLGRKFVAMGDLDNPPDGGADFAVSLHGRNQVNVYSGKTRATLHSLSDWGSWNNTGFGAGLGSADVDGDGRKDLLVGAPGFCFQGGPRDQFAASIALRKWTMSANGHAISIATGGVVTYRIDAGSTHGGKRYFVVGTWSDTRPGFPFFGHHVPLNIDAYFTLVAGWPNSPILPASFGTLDGNGVATCGFQIVPNLPPVFLGVRADHAAVVFCPSMLCADHVTNARPVTLVQ
jgi:hypothetical protein